ncbi:MAG: glycoside hydrolase family 5 protein [Oscillospiraceae bacterium]|nr:glycoside hydrolase family 5 protein [Oscillospiraceae bacterium]
MKKTKISALLCAAMLMGAALPVGTPANAADSGMRDITTMELVREMGIGINLGNTYESCGDWIAQWGDGTPESYETAWGSPVITQKMIQGYADEGFGVVRVPVAWSNMMGEDYTISPAYLEAVREVVDWALEADLYVILNIHWDGGWWENFPTDKENCMYKYTRIWTQLCEAFGSYGDHLMFESLNEEGGWSSLWNQYGGVTPGKAESFGLLNEINQTFVDLVRSSGGNNAKRHLLIAGYNTNFELTCDDLYEMPDDPENRCAVSVHYYTPATFAILEQDADWGKASSTWGTDAEFAELEFQMNLMETHFIKEGIPVIIGEYGCPTKNKEADSVHLFLKSVAEEAYERQMCPVLWDTTDLHYSRTTCKLKDQELKAAFNAITQSSAPETGMLGDVNQDGTINAADAATILTAAAAVGSGAASGLTAAQETAADVDRDSDFDAADAAVVLQYAAELGTGSTMTLEEFLASINS